MAAIGCARVGPQKWIQCELCCNAWPGHGGGRHAAGQGRGWRETFELVVLDAVSLSAVGIASWCGDA